MGLPALKHEPRAVSRRPHLRVVEPGDRHDRSKRNVSHSQRKAHAAAYQAFVFFAVIVTVVAALGAGRVWLSVQAAQASIDCGKLQSAIKTARYQGDMLQIEASALESPSRVQAIAQGQLGMAPATSVSYLRITPDAKAQIVAQVQPEPAAGSGSAVVEKLVGVAAAEARMLLVGDVGLSSTR